MLFICICVHENMKKIPARPLLIDYSLAGMGLMLSRIDSGSAEVRLVFLLIDYGLAGMDYSLFSPPFLPLMEEKEQKKIKASGTPAKLAGYQAKFPAPKGAVRNASQVCRVPGKVPSPGRGRQGRRPS